MPSCRSLLEVAKTNPAGLRFSELCKLAECFGWELARQRGSHRLYKRTGTMQMMNFQDVGGNAKEYQVRQLLVAIDELGLELQ
jgi:HicA toxin of bacterial toxin-antitoxin,